MRPPKQPRVVSYTMKMLYQCIPGRLPQKRRGLLIGVNSFASHSVASHYNATFLPSISPHTAQENHIYNVSIDKRILLAYQMFVWSVE